MRLVTRSDFCKLLHPHWEEPHLSVKGKKSSVVVAQSRNVVKRGNVLKKKLRKKQEKTLMVQRHTKVKKQTLQEGRGKQR